MTTYSKILKCSKRANEKRDCAVIAVAIATGIHYDEVRQMMASCFWTGKERY